jgi:pimeloyl-ACP methyl ester carboxylesterase
MKPLKVLGAVVVALVVIFGMLWTFVVPDMLKELIAFERWRDENTRASGTVEREPAGTRIYWEEYGVAGGPPVVVLHGGFGSIGTMGPQIRALAPTHRVLAIDSRGHNKSTNAADKLTYEMMSDDVVAVMDATKIQRGDVVGWSDGGNVGIDMARRYPDRVNKVVAFGAVYDATGGNEKDIAQMRAALPDDAGFMPVRSSYEKNNPSPGNWPVFFKQVQTMLLSEPRWTLAQLATIRAPVLLVNGEHDLVRLAHATEMKNAIPGARLEIVAGAGHEAPLANSEAVNALMMPFLTGAR